MTDKNCDDVGSTFSRVCQNLVNLNDYLEEGNYNNSRYWQKKFSESVETIEPELDAFVKEIEEALHYADAGRIGPKQFEQLVKLHKGLKQFDFSGKRKKFVIPKQITDNAVKETLEEAIEDYQNECFDSSLVMCRRTYELILFNLYTNVERKRPVDVMGGTEYAKPLNELYKWFKEKYDKNTTVERAGIMTKWYGDEAAHVPKPEPSHSTRRERAEAALSETILLAKSMFLEFTALKNIDPDDEGLSVGRDNEGAV